jgi:hypothetical protein
MDKDEYIKWSMENVDHDILVGASMELIRTLLDKYAKESFEGNTVPPIFINHEGGLQ